MVAAGKVEEEMEPEAVAEQLSSLGRRVVAGFGPASQGSVVTEAAS